MQRNTLEEVKKLEENFHKVIGYAQILMDNMRKFQTKVVEIQAQNM